MENDDPETPYTRRIDGHVVQIPRPDRAALDTGILMPSRAHVRPDGIPRPAVFVTPRASEGITETVSIVHYRFGSQTKYDAEGYKITEPQWPMFIVRFTQSSAPGQGDAEGRPIIQSSDVSMVMRPALYGSESSVPFPETIADFQAAARALLASPVGREELARLRGDIFVSPTSGTIINVSEDITSLV